jgi:hypothetical protein
MSKTKGYLHRRSKNYGKVPFELLTDKTISAGAVRLYAYMHWRYGSNMQNFESHESMATAIGVSRRTVMRYIQELENANWIASRPRSYKHLKTTNFYHVFELKADCEQWKKDHPLSDVTPESQRDPVVPSMAQPDVTPTSQPDVTPVAHDPDSLYPDPNNPDSVTSKNEVTGAQPHIAIIDAWYDGMPAPPINRKYPRNVKVAKRIASAGYDPEQVTAFVKAKYSEDYWQGKLLPLERVEDDLPLWIKQHEPPAPVHVDLGTSEDQRRLALQVKQQMTERVAAGEFPDVYDVPQEATPS